MDYVVGSVAALISGNVTPNRPKLVRRALTPTKHQPSPNVTPKSEFVEDRSIFLSPTQQKKKAIVKKSPKRIFQNPDLDATEDGEGNSSLSSPKADKVKKHLKEELEADSMAKKKTTLSNSPSSKLNKSSDDVSPQKKPKIVDSQVNTTPQKKKKRENSESTTSEPLSDNIVENNNKTPKKKRKSVTELKTDSNEAAPAYNPNQSEQSISNNEELATEQSNQETKKGKKRKKKNKKAQNAETESTVQNKENVQTTEQTKLKKSKKKKNQKNKSNQKSVTEESKPQNDEMEVDKSDSESEDTKSSNIPNPNAITEKDSDSEHDSDDDIESENEQENEKILAKETKVQESSDEEEEQESSSIKKEPSKQKEDKEVAMTEGEIHRTLFVGNVLFSSKCKKEIKKIFSKYGQIDTVRIRTIPVKDARVTPKLAVIKNELHPERTTVNVYVKFSDPASVTKALAENNTVLNNHHLRVTPSGSTGAEHDPRCAVFLGNLPFAVEDDTIRDKFQGCGEISSVRIVRDKKTNAGKGFGYVNFASKDGVELALAMSEEDLTIKNRIIRVKRCTQQRPHQGKTGGGGKWGNQGGKERWGQGGQGSQGGQRFQGAQRFQGGQRSQSGQRFQGGQWSQGGRFQGGQRSQDGPRFQGGQRSQDRPRFQGGQRSQDGPRTQGGQRSQGETKRGQNQIQEGAARRLMNKRKPDGGNSEGPPNKRQNTNQPGKEKKQRKEFVGVTAERKKKQKFDKGLKKKKALSEILTKKS